MLQQTLFPPASSWKPPRLSEMPQDWNDTPRLALDTETCDPQLKKLGPGVRRGGYVCGISFALSEDKPWYAPVAHLGGDNMEDPDRVWEYLRFQSKHYTGEIVGAKLSYDLDFLAEQGVVFRQATFRDVQVAEPLLDELQYSYSLDNILKRYGLPLKDEGLLREAAADFGFKDVKPNLHKMPARYVGPYAEADAARPLALLKLQEERIDAVGLRSIWEMESKVLPILVKMRRRGVRIDQDQLARVERFAVAEETKAWGEVLRLSGVSVSVGDAMKAEVVARVFTSQGITVPLTNHAKPKPSITKDWLEGLDHPVGKVVRRCRKMSTLRTTFVQSIKDHMVRGRIHCTFNQIKMEKDNGVGEGGAAYGRLSAEDPNLQNQPGDRDPEIGKPWRSIYVPDDGAEWGQLDYSQQEPRGALHFAVVSGPDRLGKALGSLDKGRVAHQSALEAQKRYRDDPKTDSHTMFVQMVEGDEFIHDPGFKLRRRILKEIFLGICYGMGGPKLCRNLGYPTKVIVNDRTGRRYEVAGDEGQALMDKVNRRSPWVKATAMAVEAVAKERGYVVTAGGRHCHFPRDDAGNYDWTHKAFNRAIQGTAADQVKRGMIALDAEGWKMQLQVHDELDGPLTSREQGLRYARILEECFPLEVPSKIDLAMASSWGGTL